MPRIDKSIEKLVVNLYDKGEKKSFDEIAKYLSNNVVKISKWGVIKAYYRQKNPKELMKRGPKRKTSERYNILS